VDAIGIVDADALKALVRPQAASAPCPFTDVTSRPTGFRGRQLRPQARRTSAVPNIPLQMTRWFGSGRDGTNQRKQARVIGGLADNVRQGVCGRVLARSSAEALTDTITERLQAFAWRWSPPATERHQRLGNAEAATGGRLLLTRMTLRIAISHTATATAAMALHRGADVTRGGGRVSTNLVERPPVVKRVFVAVRGRMAVNVGGGERDGTRGCLVDGGGANGLRTVVAEAIPPR
jgi:hypothetical protein